ncbi:hypothetical protein P0136_09850 [Lentisphaerota bacterium ZTH]|nr:hypothetical protein P0136_09850 [Lentisphaerota bacterium ZTH]
MTTQEGSCFLNALFAVSTFIDCSAAASLTVVCSTVVTAHAALPLLFGGRLSLNPV